MTKAEIQALIAENLADFSNIVPSKHREVENAILDYIEKPVNRGAFSGWNLESTSGTLAVSLDCTSAEIQSDKTVLVTVPNAMSGTDYFVRLSVESLGDIVQDRNSVLIMFKKINSTSFKVACGELSSATQDLKVYFDVINY